jgi:hypothetical protein
MTVNDEPLHSKVTASRMSEERDPEKVPRTSAIIARLAWEKAGQEVSIAEIVTALQDRSFGVLMILFALPNVVIPGISVVMGLPIILFGLQIASGRQKVWLPGFMMNKKLSASLFQNAASRVEQFLSRIESWLRPRWLFFFTGIGERLLGLYLSFLAFVLMAPIPFGNALPAFGISFISIGIIEKDGVAVVIGIILGLLGTAFIATAIGGLFALALVAFGYLF